jgi:hypothetical protein
VVETPFLGHVTAMAARALWTGVPAGHLHRGYGNGGENPGAENDEARSLCVHDFFVLVFCFETVLGVYFNAEDDVRHAMPCPASLCHAAPGRATPALPRLALPRRAVPSLAESRLALPAAPRLAAPCQASPRQILSPRKFKMTPAHAEGFFTIRPAFANADLLAGSH